jgi:hypothetical protein
MATAPIKGRASGAGTGNSQSVDIAGASYPPRRTMANVSEFSIVTYLRKPGHWRAAIIPRARIGSVGGERVRSVVTPDDSASEVEAQLAAEKLIRRL